MNSRGYDVATALWQGARPYQEDTLLADFHGGVDRGFAVLADGMGGHTAGDLASRLVVIDAASHLKFLMHDGDALENTLAAELTSAIKTANDVLKDRVADDSRLHGMGTTFLATVVFEDRLYWASVGDSPLYLWREGALRQLNEDHSMAPVIDQMAKSGEITQAEAAAHPDRNALTSVLMGRALKTLDIPDTATVLDPGDVLIQASDGLQYLDDQQISDVVARGGSSRQIADALMASLHDLGDPAQDNTAILVLQLSQASGAVSVTPHGSTASASERLVGTAGTPETGLSSTPRAVTPIPATRPLGARRWVLPAGVLSAAAVAAGLMFGLPNGLTGPDPTLSEPQFETAALAPEDAPVPQPAAPAVATPLPQAATPSIARAPVPATASTTPVPIADAPAGGATIAFGAASSASGGIGAPQTRIIGDKFAQSSTPQVTAAGATLQFDEGGVEIAPLSRTIAPQSEGSDAPEAAEPEPVVPPASQRTAVPQGSSLNAFAPRTPLRKARPGRLKVQTIGCADHG